MAEADPLYQLDRRVMIESRGCDGTTLVNLDTLRRVKLGTRAVEILRAFSEPASLSDIRSRSECDIPSSFVLSLSRQGFLRRVGIEDGTDRAEMPRRRRPQRNFCDSAVWDPSSPSDVAVVGFPSDATGDTESRGAPEVLRKVSSQWPYRVPLRTGRPCGWFDGHSSSWVLRGMSLADWGDVAVIAGEPLGKTRQRAFEVVSACLKDGGSAIILGGSVSLADLVCERFELTQWDVIREDWPGRDIPSGVAITLDLSVLRSSTALARPISTSSSLPTIQAMQRLVDRHPGRDVRYVEIVNLDTTEPDAELMAGTAIRMAIAGLDKRALCV